MDLYSIWPQTIPFSAYKYQQCGIRITHQPKKSPIPDSWRKILVVLQIAIILNHVTVICRVLKPGHYPSNKIHNVKTNKLQMTAKMYYLKEK